MYFWDLAWLEDGVGDAAKGGADVEGDDEGARGPVVGLAHVGGGLCHGRRKDMGRIRLCTGSPRGSGTRKRVLKSLANDH